jgi:hypothetical protein
MKTLFNNNSASLSSKYLSCFIICTIIQRYIGCSMFVKMYVLISHATYYYQNMKGIIIMHYLFIIPSPTKLRRNIVTLPSVRIIMYLVPIQFNENKTKSTNKYVRIKICIWKHFSIIITINKGNAKRGVSPRL